MVETFKMVGQFMRETLVQLDFLGDFLVSQQVADQTPERSFVVLPPQNSVNLLPFEQIEVSHVLNESLIHELVNKHLTHALDVHRATRSEMTDGALELCGTGDVLTAPRDELRVAMNRAFAHRAFMIEILVEFELLSLLCPLLCYANDCGDDLAGLFNDDCVTDLNFFAIDFLLVVQRRAGDLRPR